MTATEKDVVVVGGGQAGLATGWFLLRAKIDYVILDDGEAPGGAWRHGWDTLRLFSPAGYSSLPGWPMPPPAHDSTPTRDDVIAYLAAYEARYALTIERPVTVSAVSRARDGRLLVKTDRGDWLARAIIGTTGTWSSPTIPDYPGRDSFDGDQIHSAHYSGPSPFVGRNVIIVGGGNSGAQIHAEVSKVANSTWVTLKPPQFLADDVDGRVLFERASQRWRAKEGIEPHGPPPGGLGDIVMVEPVKAARNRGVLHAVRPFVRFTPDGVVWADGGETPVDAVIWCTGFGPALSWLDGLGVRGADGKVAVTGTRSVDEQRLWLVGYGEWTGYASATLIGVMRGARQTVTEIAAALGGPGAG